VTDGTSPIAGATIVVYQGRNIIGSCITGSNGQCTITGLVDGDYTYSVAATGYTPITDGIFNITGLNCSTINVVLSLQTCSASFHVHEYIEKTQTYQDIAGAHAYIGLGVGNIVSCTTDANGLCSIPGIPDGDYPYEVHYSGHTLESGTYHVAGNICPAITTEFMICNVVFYIYHNTQPPEPFVGAAFYLDSVYYANSDASGGVWFNGANALYTGTYQYDVYQSGPPPAGWHIPFAPPPLTITIPQSGSCPGLQSIAVPET
jgi:hypothetical protein